MPVLKNIFAVTPSLLHLVIHEDLPARLPLTEVPDPPVGNGVVAISNITNNGSGKVRITLPAASLSWAVAQGSGDVPHMVSIFGATGLIADINGSHHFTKIDDQTFDLVKVAFPGGYSFVTGPKLFFRSEYQHGNFAFQAERVNGQGNEFFRWVGDGQPPLRQWNRGLPTRVNEAVIKTAAGYSVGAIGVTNVYRRKVPIDSWQCVMLTGIWGFTVAWEHGIFLQLATPMTDGQTYTVSLPAGLSIASRVFKFDSLKSVNSAIHVTPRITPGAKSKTASLGRWVPGLNATGSSVDYSAFTGAPFKIISDGGSVEYSGTIAFRKGWNDTDPLMSLAGETHGFSNFGKPPRTITNMVPLAGLKVWNYTTSSFDSITGWQVTFTGDNLVENQMVAIGGIQGCRGSGTTPMCDTSLVMFHARDVNNSNASAKTCSLHYYMWTSDPIIAQGNAFPSAGATPYSSGGKMWDCIENNVAGINVWSMDFSDWTPSRPGLYRVQIPGLGTSLPFVADPAAMFDYAKAFIGGEFMQRHGQVFANEFGVTRPQSPRPAKKIHKSKMPALFSTECFAGAYMNYMGLPAVSHTQGTNPAWLDGLYTPPVGAKLGSLADAGDPDSFPGTYHWDSAAGHFIAWLLAPDATRNVNFGLPSMQATWGADWAGTDGLSDMLNAGLYQALGLRWFKNATTKMVSGGLQMTGTALSDPWGQNPSDWYVYEQDHFSTFNSAGLKFLAAACLKKAAIQQPAMATVLNARAAELDAEAAEEYAAANEIFASPAAAAARYDAAFALGGYTAANKTTFFNSTLVFALPYLCKQGKMFASAAGFLSKGAVAGAAYKTDFEFFNTSGAGGIDEYRLGDADKNTAGRICYALASDATPAIVSKIQGSIKTLIEDWFGVTGETDGAGGSHYKFPRYKLQRARFGQGMYGANSQHFNYHIMYYIAKIDAVRGLKLLEQKMAWKFGGNQMNVSFVSGIGHNPITGFLHNDCHIHGIDPLKWKGLGVYGPMNIPRVMGVVSTNTWKSVASEQETVTHAGLTQNDIDSFTTNKGADIIDPPIHAWPIVEKMFPVRDMDIESMEFTQQETIGCNADLCFTLHTRSGAVSNEKFGGKKRFRIAAP